MNIIDGGPGDEPSAALREGVVRFLAIGCICLGAGGCLTMVGWVVRSELLDQLPFWPLDVGYVGVFTGSWILRGVLHVPLLIGGIGLMRQRRWSMRLLVATAWLMVVVLITSQLVFLAFHAMSGTNYSWGLLREVIELPHTMVHDLLLPMGILVFLRRPEFSRRTAVGAFEPVMPVLPLEDERT